MKRAAMLSAASLFTLAASPALAQDRPPLPNILDAGNTGDAAGLPTFIGGAPRMYGVQASVRF